MRLWMELGLGALVIGVVLVLVLRAITRERRKLYKLEDAASKLGRNRENGKHDDRVA